MRRDDFGAVNGLLADRLREGIDHRNRKAAAGLALRIVTAGTDGAVRRVNVVAFVFHLADVIGAAVEQTEGLRHIGRLNRQRADGVGLITFTVGGIQPDDAVHRLSAAGVGLAHPARDPFDAFRLLPELGELRCGGGGDAGQF